MFAFLTCVTVVGGGGSRTVREPEFPRGGYRAANPISAFYLWCFRVTNLHLSPSPHPVIISSFKTWKTPMESEQPPLTCPPPCSYKVLLDPCFKWVWWIIWHLVPCPPSGTTVEDAGRPVPLVPTPDPFASVNTGFSGRTEEILSVHENGWEKALGSCTHCGNMKRSVNKPRDTPHRPDAAAVKHTHFHIAIHCWRPLKNFSTQERVEGSERTHGTV